MPARQIVAEVFADEACTTRATGVVDTVYVKIYKDFILGDEYLIPADSGTEIKIENSTIELPEDPYYIIYYEDYFSDDFDNPFRVGDVIKVQCDEEGAADMSELNNVFYDDGSAEHVD